MSQPDLDLYDVRVRKETELFHGAHELTDFSILDFRCWAYSDLVTNTTRGVLTEYPVARALGCSEKESVRAPWNPYDLETRTGSKVEVESAADLQRWPQKSVSRLSFNIRETRAERGRLRQIPPAAGRRVRICIARPHGLSVRLSR